MYYLIQYIIITINFFILPCHYCDSQWQPGSSSLLSCHHFIISSAASPPTKSQISVSVSSHILVSPSSSFHIIDIPLIFFSHHRYPSNLLLTSYRSPMHLKIIEIFIFILLITHLFPHPTPTSHRWLSLQVLHNPTCPPTLHTMPAHHCQSQTVPFPSQNHQRRVFRPCVCPRVVTGSVGTLAGVER